MHAKALLVLSVTLLLWCPPDVKCLQNATVPEADVGTDPFEGIAEAISKSLDKLMELITKVIAMLNRAFLYILRVSYVTIGLLGVVLYFLHLDKRRGYDFMKSAILMFLVTEAIFILFPILR